MFVRILRWICSVEKIDCNFDLYWYQTSIDTALSKHVERKLSVIGNVYSFKQKQKWLD